MPKFIKNRPTREQIETLRNDGKTYSEIAKLFAVSRTAITNWLKNDIKPRPSLIGQKFGGWEVVGLGERKGSGSRMRQFWLCKCTVCNVTEMQFREDYLFKRISSQCIKCRRIHQPWRLPIKVLTVNTKLCEYRSSEKQRDRANRQIKFNLSREEFEALIFAQCFFCGDEPNKTPTSGKRTLLPSHGIDRLDNTLSYTKGNSVTCCWLHNKMKGSLSLSDFNHGIISAFRHKLLTLPDRLMKGEKIESEDDELVLAIYQAIARDMVMQKYIELGLITINPSVTPESEKARYLATNSARPPAPSSPEASSA